MDIGNWRLERLLWNRKRNSLNIVPWPDTKACQVIKDFTHRGQLLHRFDRFKGHRGDSIELPAAEAKELQARGLVAAFPAADRFKCGPEQITGWIPWNRNYGAPSTDWNGRGGLDFFDDCLIRISYLGRIGGIQLCPGLILSATDPSIYYPFGAIRPNPYHCEDDAQPTGLIKLYLDEFSPAFEHQQQPSIP
jgi:hypothetical protein